MPTYQDIFGQLSAGKVLDVATGNGGFISILLDSLKDYEQFIGIDPGERGAKAFKQTFEDQPVHFLRMAAESMAFSSGDFDTVCIANSLHHMANLAAALEEMQRVLRLGGHFVIAEMYRDNQIETQQTHVLLHHWWAAIDRANGITHHETYTRQEIVAIIETLGLEDWDFYDLAFLEENPKDPDLLQELDKGISTSIQRVETLVEHATFKAHGEELRRRIIEVGFHGATSLVAIAVR